MLCEPQVNNKPLRTTSSTVGRPYFLASHTSRTKGDHDPLRTLYLVPNPCATFLEPWWIVIPGPSLSRILIYHNPLRNPARFSLWVRTCTAVFSSDWQCSHFHLLTACSRLTDYTPESFSWPEYLAKTGGIEAPPLLFRQVIRNSRTRSINGGEGVVGRPVFVTSAVYVLAPGRIKKTRRESPESGMTHLVLSGRDFLSIETASPLDSVHGVRGGEGYLLNFTNFKNAIFLSILPWTASYSQFTSDLTTNSRHFTHTLFSYWLGERTFWAWECKGESCLHNGDEFNLITSYPGPPSEQRLQGRHETGGSGPTWARARVSSDHHGHARLATADSLRRLGRLVRPTGRHGHAGRVPRHLLRQARPPAAAARVSARQPTSIMCQRLLHKMTNSRVVFIARVYVGLTLSVPSSKSTFSQPS